MRNRRPCLMHNPADETEYGPIYRKRLIPYHSTYDKLMSKRGIGVSTFLTALILGSDAIVAVHYLRDYQFEELPFVVEVDYGEATGIEDTTDRGMHLRNDPSQSPSGAQISIDGIQGDAYVFFDWLVSQSEGGPGNFSYIKILESPHAAVYLEKNFHDGSMEKDQDSVRAYLKPGSTYSVKIGLEAAEPTSDTYRLIIQNLKIRRYHSLEIDSYSRNDPLLDLLVAPVSVDPDSDNDRDENNGTSSTGSGPDYETGDPPTRSPGAGNPGSGPGFDTGDPPTRGPGAGNTGSDFNTGDPLTRDPSDGGNGFTGDAPKDPENDSFGTDEPILPLVDLNFPGMIPTRPISPPISDMGTAPVLIRSEDFPFTDPIPNNPVSTGQGPTARVVPDSSLGFLPIATLIGLLFAKAFLPSNSNRRRD